MVAHKTRPALGLENRSFDLEVCNTYSNIEFGRGTGMTACNCVVARHGF